MEYSEVLLPLALILAICKLLAIICKKIGLPQVIGYLIGGILIGFIKYIPNQPILTDVSTEGLGFIAKIGVILIMFSAGLGTDLKQVKATGIKSVLVTLAGVIMPMALGFFVSILFFGGFGSIKENYKEGLAYGCILTATSVSVTVATLKELGKLNSKMGTCIVSAAILDDIIGIIVLSVVVGLSGSNSSDEAYLITLFDKVGMNDAISSVLGIVLYFIIFIGLGILMAKWFKHLAIKYGHKRRIPILALALCFLYAYMAEEVFGVADITGAYLAGLLLSTNVDTDYIDSKADTFSSLFFTPVFFANIGINISFDSIDSKFILFGICFIIAGILGKLIGCGGTAYLCGFNLKESLSIGVGMIVRAEVALVCTDKLANTVNSNITTFVVILILVTSLAAPIFLKLLNKDKNENLNGEAKMEEKRSL